MCLENLLLKITGEMLKGGVRILPPSPTTVRKAGEVERHFRDERDGVVTSTTVKVASSSSHSASGFSTRQVISSSTVVSS